MFFSVPITDINITCDKDIDAQHPANSSIDDHFCCFRILQISLLKVDISHWYR